MSDETPKESALVPVAVTDESEGVPITRRQVFIMVTDAILEGLYRNSFQNTDYCVVWCEKGERWREALATFPYDVVVVDFSLFPEDPIDRLLEIKRVSPESDIIAISESDDVRIAIAAFQSGISNYFLKPVNPETLVWAIERILKRRDFTSSNESLAADLRVFSAAHQIHVAESDDKMRDLTLKQLQSILGATGGVWVWPETDKSKAADGIRLEGVGLTKESEAAAKKALHALGLTDGDALRRSFESGLTSRPAEWVKQGMAWAPLRTAWMGGCLLYDATAFPTDTPGAAFAARIEFLIRNLEVSLENYRRFVQARQLTYIDELTGLYNARYLEIAVGAAMEKFRENRSGFSILFIDVDRFKSVNDTHGHLVGSQLLVEVAHHLKRSLRKKDYLFRYGGDEFICLLYDISLEKAMEAAERIRANMEKHRFLIQNKEIKVTLSIGVARFPEHGQNRDRVMQMADEAMYAGKKSGRNAVFVAPQAEPQKDKPAEPKQEEPARKTG